MDIIANLLARLRENIAEIYQPSPQTLERISLERPKNPEHGCLATNAAMILAKELKKNPREIAQEISRLLSSWDEIHNTDIAGPGFINVHMTNSFWHSVIHIILKEKNNYGKQPTHNKTINVEYISANPTGPLHVAHARGAVIGDVIANLFSWSGYQVSREFYVNDAGAQINIFAQSAFLRYKEALGINISIPDDHYPGEYLIDVGQELKETYSDSLLSLTEQDALQKVKDFALKSMIALIKKDLEDLGISQNFVYESTVINAPLKSYIDTLHKKKLIYDGYLEPPKGQVDPSWKSKKLRIFASTKFGDDVDRPLFKDDHTPTYFGNDLLYHAHKISRGYDQLINVLGADHGGYVKRLQAVVEALSDGRIPYPIIICQIVRLSKDGKPFVMSKRAGSFIRLSDLTQITGPDAIRFFMLTRKADAHIDFNIDIVTQQTQDNPVFYVQYAHARCCSILRLAKEHYGEESISPEQLLHADLSSLSHHAEKNIIRRIALFPNIVNASTLHIEPHRIAFYSRELAADFHSLWNLGNSQHELRFINQENVPHTMARLALVFSVRQTLANSLHILGISPLSSL